MKLFFLCLSIGCLIIFSIFAIDRRPVVIVFDYGGVVAHADKIVLLDFLSDSFNMTQKDFLEELKKYPRDHITNKSTEDRYWLDFALSRGIILPEDWLDQLERKKLEAIHSTPGIFALINALKDKGYRLAMLSNVTADRARIIRKAGYYRLFDPVLLSYEIGVKKPNKQAFEILLSVLQTSSKQCIFIDDKLRNVRAAEELGIDAIYFQTVDRLVKEFKKRKIFLHDDI